MSEHASPRALDRPEYSVHRHRDGIAEVFFKMPVVVDRALEALFEACTMCAADEGVKRILFDMRDVTLHIPADEKDDFPARAASFGLTPDDRLAGLIRVDTDPAETCETGLVSMGFTCRVFTDQTEAIAWLNQR